MDFSEKFCKITVSLNLILHPMSSNYVILKRSKFLTNSFSVLTKGAFTRVVLQCKCRLHVPNALAECKTSHFPGLASWSSLVCSYVGVTPPLNDA